MASVSKIAQVSVVGAVALACSAVTLLLIQEHTVVPQLSLATALRSEDVVVFVKASSPDDAERLLRYVQPAQRNGVLVPEATSGSGTYELALLSRGEEQRWIVQQTTRNASLISGTGTGWMLSKQEARVQTLFTAPEYRRMVREQSPAVWMRINALELSSTAADQVLSAMLSPYAAVQWSGSTRSLALVRSERQAKRTPAGWHPYDAPSSSHVHLADNLLGQRLQAWHAAITTTNAAMAEGWSGVLRQHARTLLGQDAAYVAEGLVPFVQGMRIAHGSGGLAGAAVLYNADGKQVRVIADAFAATLPQSIVRSIELEKNTRTDIAVDTNAVQQESAQVDGWEVVHIYARGSDKELVVATRDRWAVIGTRKWLVQDMLAPQTGTAAPGGSWNGDVALQTAERLLPALYTRETSLFWQLLSGKHAWTLTTLPEADVLTFTTIELD